jgi:hypothetical protein
MKFMMAVYPIINPRPNKIAPDINAIIVKPTTNLVIYLLRPDYYVLAFAARFAIRPINVLSPVAKTIPFPVPSLFKVEKNAIFLV